MSECVRLCKSRDKSNEKIIKKDKVWIKNVCNFKKACYGMLRLVYNDF